MVDSKTCDFLLNIYYPDKDYEVISWELKGFGSRVGFFGDHKTLVVAYKRHDEVKTTSFFVKTISSDPLISDHLIRCRAFEKEFHMYKNVLHELQKGIGGKLFPRCFLNKLNSILILEDLGALGYRSLKAPCNMIQSSKVIENLAMLHATSIIYEEKTRDTITNRFPEICFETLINEKSKMEGETFKVVNNYVKYSVYDLKLVEIKEDHLDSFVLWIKDTQLKLVKPSKKFRNVLCHGDPWFANFMFRFKESGEISEMVLVDFQFCRFAPPGLELQHFLNLNYCYDEAVANGPKLLTIYYNAFSKYLSEAGFDAKNLLPFTELKESFEYYRSYGVLSRLIYSTITCIPTEVLQTVDTSEKYMKLISEGDFELFGNTLRTNQNFQEVIRKNILAAYKKFIENM